MNLSDMLREIGSRYSSNPSREFTSLAVGVLCLFAAIPAIDLFFTFATETGREWAYLNSHFALKLISGIAWTFIIGGSIWFHFRKRSVKSFPVAPLAVSLVVASICGVVVWTAVL